MITYSVLREEDHFLQENIECIFIDKSLLFSAAAAVELIRRSAAADYTFLHELLITGKG